MPNIRSPRFASVIPPYLLKRIMEKGSEHQRLFAHHTLTHVHNLMGRNPSVAHYSNAQAPGKIKRTIYDIHNSINLPGIKVRQEGQPTGKDVAVNEAYDYLGITYDFYWRVFQRNSLDARGLPLVGTVHYGSAYENAFWNGEQRVFGDGDGEIFNRFTIALDVVAHELTHGVTEHEANLIYFEQARSLIESLSDVFGSLVKQYHLRQTARQADWLIGGLRGSMATGYARCRLPAPPMTIRYWAKIPSRRTCQALSTRGKIMAASTSIPVSPSRILSGIYRLGRQCLGKSGRHLVCYADG